MNTPIRILSLLAGAACAAALVGGCNEEADRSPCDDVIAFDGADYCIVIEEGFLESECPDEYPEGRDFGDVVVCTDGDDVPDDIEEELVRLGYLEEPLVCPDEADPLVEYANTDPEICATLDDLTCPEGATLFNDACGCGCVLPGTEPECTDGDEERVECNDCICVDGAWACDDNDCSLCPDPDDPNVTYASDDPDICMVADLAACPEGTEFFDNYCGCGCVGDGTTECSDGDTRREECNDCVCVDGAWACDAQECASCPDLEDPGVTWFGFSEEECAAVLFECEPGEIAFGEWCGCGCIEQEVFCPDEEEPNVDYVSRDPAECALIDDLSCPDGATPFNDACGCGCIGGAECTDGDVREEDCNTCTCSGGIWTCTGLDCTELCLADCGVGCPAPEYMLCGEDGDLYCNECVMDCYDVAESDDPEVCVDCPTTDDPGVDRVIYASTDLMECAVIDLGCPPSFIGFENQCGCGCVEYAPTECAAGETLNEGCVSCSCLDGYWDCDASACETTEACLETCSDECAPVADQLCGANGAWYCDDCELLCYDVEGARGDAVCDRCATPDDADAITWRQIDWPDGCADTFDDVWTEAYSSELEFLSSNPCHGGSPDVDWATERLVRFVASENPDATLRDVAIVDGTVTAFIEGDVYCGGPAPMPTVVLVAVPDDSAPVDALSCTVGTCGHGPLPP